MQTLIELDQQLLLFLNSFHTPYLDQLFWLITGQLMWYFPVLVLFIIFFKKGFKEGILAVLMVALVVLMADQLSSTICKPFFARLRPTREPAIMDLIQVVNGYRSGTYGFISGHATNSFGIATFLLLLFRNRLFTFNILLVASLLTYSRIYLGVHYPGDIICGGIAGMFIGMLCYKIYKYLHKKLFKTESYPYLKDKGVNIVNVAIFLTYILALIAAPIINLRIN